MISSSLSDAGADLVVVFLYQLSRWVFGVYTVYQVVFYILRVAVTYCLYPLIVRVSCSFCVCERKPHSMLGGSFEVEENLSVDAPEKLEEADRIEE